MRVSLPEAITRSQSPSPSPDATLQDHFRCAVSCPGRPMTMTMKAILATLLATMMSGPMVAGAERMLLPVYTPVPLPGALGSEWETKLAFFNPTSDSYIIEHCSPVDPEGGCDAILYGDAWLEPGETQRILPRAYPLGSGIAGYVLYLSLLRQAGSGEEVPIPTQLRVRDLSRNASSAGTEIPVVREAAFRDKTFHLLSVPTDGRFRPLLRIYEMNLDKASFNVKVFEEATGALVRQETITLETPVQGLLRFQPGFYQSAELLAPVSSGNAASLRVEIEPRTAGSRSWAFVSVTNNTTQELTVITP
jgi:hypothetical protein